MTRHERGIIYTIRIKSGQRLLTNFTFWNKTYNVLTTTVMQIETFIKTYSLDILL